MLLSFITKTASLSFVLFAPLKRGTLDPASGGTLRQLKNVYARNNLIRKKTKSSKVPVQQYYNNL
jgi:hypothetical protein